MRHRRRRPPGSATRSTTAELDRIDAYWRAANYLSVGQIYLLDNPLLREPLRPEHVKPRLLGHWGTTPGLNFIYAHLNRVIRELGPRRDLRHRARVTAARRWSPTPTSRAPTARSTRHHPRRRRACASCSASSPSRAASPATSRPRRRARSTRAASSATRSSHAYGAAFDNPDLLVCCVVGDGEAETGPLATSWHSNKFLDPARDGAVLPILHLNGYKIANPTVLARIPQDELRALLEGYGYQPLLRRGRRPGAGPPADGRASSTRWSTRSATSSGRRASGGVTERPRWPMIVLRTPKGWTGPKEVDGAAGRGHLARRTRCR